MKFSIPDTVYLAICKNKSVLYNSITSRFEGDETKIVGYHTYPFLTENEAKTFSIRNPDYEVSKHNNNFNDLVRVNAHHFQNKKKWFLNCDPFLTEQSNSYSFCTINGNLQVLPKDSANWKMLKKQIANTSSAPIANSSIITGGEYILLNGQRKIVLGKVNSVRTYHYSDGTAHETRINNGFLVLNVYKYSDNADFLINPIKYLKTQSDIAKYVKVIQKPTFRNLDQTHKIEKNIISKIKKSCNEVISEGLKRSPTGFNWIISSYSDILNMEECPNVPDYKNLQSIALTMFS